MPLAQCTAVTRQPGSGAAARQGGRLRQRIAILPAPLHITHIDCIPATIKRAEHRQSPFPFQFRQTCAQQTGCGAQTCFGGVAMRWEGLRVARCARIGGASNSCPTGGHLMWRHSTWGASGHLCPGAPHVRCPPWAPARAKVPRSPRDPLHRTIRLPPRKASWAYTSVYTVRLNRNGEEVAWASSHDAAHEELTRAPLLALFGTTVRYQPPRALLKDNFRGVADHAWYRLLFLTQLSPS